MQIYTFKCHEIQEKKADNPLLRQLNKYNIAIRGTSIF